MELRDLIIDPEFRSLIPSLSPEEYDLLKNNIIEDGVVHDPIIVWAGQNIIVDGHNRYTILQDHPEITFTTFEKEFSCREEVIEWICLHQLGRRNLTEMQKTILIGKAHEARKKLNFGANERERDDHGHFLPGSTKRTEEIVADERGVNATYVKASARFVRGLDQVEEAFPGTYQRINNGEIEVTKKDVMALTSMPEDQKQEALKAISEGKRIPREYRDGPIATVPTHDGEYDIQNFRDAMQAKVTTLKRSLELTIIMTHKDIAETEEGKEAIRDALLSMTEIIKYYLEMYCSN